jgi:hypothetical protein
VLSAVEMGRFLQSAAASALILTGMAVTLSSCLPAQQRPDGMPAVETIPANTGPPPSLPSGTAHIPATPTAAGVAAIGTEERGNEAAMTPTEKPVSTRDALVALARQNLASRLGYGPEQADSGILVVQATAQEWPDASLGCPQPGMMYAQVITPGYQIILEAAGRRYDYRAPMRHDGPVRLCTPQKATAPGRSR